MGNKEFEIMKKPGRGTNGHIAIGCNNVDRAIYHLSQRGVKFDLDSKNVKNGKTIATINMDGAAITITIMTLAAANTLGIQVSLPAAIVLSAMSALGACGASGVAGGSLLLIPMACSLFGISNDVAMQMVGVGFIIGVVQDSVETALNSAGDVEFAATAEYHQWRKQGKPLPEFLSGKKN